jgi:hypothetical protein
MSVITSRNNDSWSAANIGGRDELTGNGFSSSIGTEILDGKCRYYVVEEDVNCRKPRTYSESGSSQSASNFLGAGQGQCIGHPMNGLR